MKLLSILILLAMNLNGCNDETTDTNTSSDCDYKLVVDAQQYKDAPSDYIHIDTVIITNDCMEITFGASGCDGNTWKVQLLGDGSTMESFPVQTQLRLSLENKELCAAYFTKTINFDISALKIESYNQIILNIDDYAHGSITYNY